MTVRQQPSAAIWQAVVIAAALLATYAYIPDTVGGWNQDSRFGLTRAIAEGHRLNIDGYDRNTGDRASWQGRNYSSKAPGLALSAVPVWDATAFVLRAFHRDPASGQSVDLERYVATVLCVALPSALAAALLFLIALRLGASSAGAAFAAIALGLATPFWCYATLFWGHNVAGALLFAAFAGFLALDGRSPARDLWLAAFVGVTAAWAVLTDFPAAPPAALIVALVLARAATEGVQRLTRVAAICCLAALPAAILLLGYNALAFGSPFRLGYDLEAQQNWPEMQRGLLGVMYPRPSVLYEILFGRFRGLLPLAPIVAAAPIGLVMWWRRAESRTMVVAATAVALFYLLLNASMQNWTGGWTYGPRYVAPALPFLCLPLAILWTRSTRSIRVLLAALAAYGIVMSLVAVSTVSQPPEYVGFPIHELWWPTFLEGRVTRNAGMLVGLSGVGSLAPLLAIWAGALGVWTWLNVRVHGNK